MEANVVPFDRNSTSLPPLPNKKSTVVPPNRKSLLSLPTMRFSPVTSWAYGASLPLASGPASSRPSLSRSPSLSCSSPVVRFTNKPNSAGDINGSAASMKASTAATVVSPAAGAADHANSKLRPTPPSRSSFPWPANRTSTSSREPSLRSPHSRSSPAKPNSISLPDAPSSPSRMSSPLPPTNSPRNS